MTWVHRAATQARYTELPRDPVHRAAMCTALWVHTPENRGSQRTNQWLPEGRRWGRAKQRRGMKGSRLLDIK